ncbi:hypothetical protein G5I_10678 [Acromyrmex echinatior]|uniref:Uncharacterized protein n=1 Tax=Acromyrmex echinatior TaxID=103372 RepID=F4WXJ3_ACREC|nr:hypothetical protein G5I_10678 [Acromyrmex echinatior]
MSSKRRTFHVDWDSPSHETGTVKRRPTSLNASFSVSLNDHFENVEYYELQDCVGGYGLRRLELTGSGTVDSNAAKDILEGTEVEATVNDDKNSLGYFQLNHPCKKDDDSEKFEALAQTKRALVKRRFSQENFGEWEKDFLKNSFVKNHKFHKKEIKNETDKKFKGTDKVFEEIRLRNLSGEKVEIRKVFGLNLYCEPIEWKPTVCRAIRRSESLKFKSLIPRPKAMRSCKNRGLVSSSSESSGFGSPLSPLSPQQDLLIKKETTKDNIKTSDSKSSGLGSPESPSSPLSPESQKYSAFHLIQLQLEKLRNCPCEERQAKGYRIFCVSKASLSCGKMIRNNPEASNIAIILSVIPFSGGFVTSVTFNWVCKKLPQK